MKFLFNIIKSIFLFLFDLIQIAKGFFIIPKFVLGKTNNHTYYPKEKRKSKLRIFFDLLMWLLKNKEVNEFYFIYGFDIKKSRKYNNYISYNKFKRIRDERNKKSLFDQRVLLRDKFIFNQYVSSLNFPVPRTIGFIKNGIVDWLLDDKSFPINNIMKEIKTPIQSFCKDIYGENGISVYKFDLLENNILIDNKFVESKDLLKYFKGNFFIQEAIKQHPDIDKFYNLSTNTLRLYTIKEGNKFKLFYGIMRFGLNGNLVDNWATGGVIVKVDIKTGMLKEHGYMKPQYGGIVDEHISSKIKFKDFHVPFFDETVELVEKLHKYFNNIHSIGWDVAITPNGPVLIEGNDNWEITVMQILDNKGWNDWFINHN